MAKKKVTDPYLKIYLKTARETGKKFYDEYLPPEKVLVVNNNPDDRDLKPIEIPLPVPDDVTKIDGYGEVGVHQFFKTHAELYPKPYRRLMDLQKKCDTVDQCVETIRSNPSEYVEEIEYIQREWDYRLNGYWFFNNKRPTFISGAHWLYLNHWYAGKGHPNYRSRDRKFYIFADFVDNDPLACGFNYPKFRREGATSKTSCLEYHIITKERGAHGGIQSKDDASASNVFQKHLVQSWKKLPFWFKPVQDGRSDPKSSLNFFAPGKSSGQGSVANVADCLESWIDFGSSTEGHYDGTKLRFHYGDEVAKCLAPGTLVRMFDGTLKKVEDIVAGDQVMGDDSTPRNVLSTTSGIDDMYTIIPNKGDPWGCNKAHILSLKLCSRDYKGYKHNDTMNISVEEYLKMSGRAKKHSMLYRVGVEYPEQEHGVLNPYILGLWLGDGMSASCGFANTDKEVLGYLKDYADKNNLKFNHAEKCSYRFAKKSRKKCGNDFWNALKSCNLVSNKHIPSNYLIDSKKNRLELLAGLIDTDGYFNGVGNKRGYEITQKRKELSYQIQELANSLGFYCSIKEKIATMKRVDGSIYRCPVYNMGIYGNNLEEIPCKIKRKIATKVENKHINTRNVQRSGFKVEYAGIGKYYGFTIDGNRLFLLKDFTVTHNTKEVNIYNRHLVIRPCVTEGNKFIGLIINTSTVGDMESGGGEEFKKLCKQSDYHKRNENGETITGLYNLFIPSYDGFSGTDPKTGKPFINKYGESDEKSAKEYLLRRRKALLNSGDIDGYVEEVRQYPLTFAECFTKSSLQANFNTQIITDRLTEFQFGNNFKARGNFEWLNGKDSEVIWMPDPKNGKFIASYLLTSQFANRKMMEGGVTVPGNRHRFVAGGDPFKYNDVKNQDKKSDGAGAVFMKYDPALDNPNGDQKDWITDRFVCTYSNRPKTTDEYAEDMLKMCVYYGCEMFPEINVPLLWDHFRDRGYKGYLYYQTDAKTGRYSSQPGANTGAKVQQMIYSAWYNHIERNGKREVHDELLIQCRDIEDDMGPFDLFVAGGYALMAASKQEKTPTENKDIKSFHRKFTYHA